MIMMGKDIPILILAGGKGMQIEDFTKRAKFKF